MPSWQQRHSKPCQLCIKNVIIDRMTLYDNTPLCSWQVSCHGSDGVISVLCTPIQTKRYSLEGAGIGGREMKKWQDIWFFSGDRASVALLGCDKLPNTSQDPIFHCRKKTQIYILCTYTYTHARTRTHTHTHTRTHARTHYWKLCP